ncbi:hypothetical protein PRIPAC_79408 [Pristionchus pacificus]|uniref:Uncharacterized protein n=1 Tax=Pristionchus pacificus TaxID=54126 RepID=A0A454XL45_PRIPA|nr:hypothetical protein PRIPAC_79408 [Pristionchus pacificus]|eukprot:PDM78176.1 hypothetical protein PRIPAC_30755 [Pristionchus pacificus]
MSTYWLRNMTGVGLCDAQLEIVPYPLAELGIHITCKTIQAGTLLGSVIGSAIGLAKRKEIKAALIKGGKYGIVVGAVLGPIMTVMAMRGKSAPEIIDRCFRLRHNFGQLWVDRSFFLAVTIGLLSAGPAGAVAGINGAVIVSPLGRAAWEGLTSGFGKKL